MAFSWNHAFHRYATATPPLTRVPAGQRFGGDPSPEAFCLLLKSASAQFTRRRTAFKRLLRLGPSSYSEWANTKEKARRSPGRRALPSRDELFATAFEPATSRPVLGAASLPSPRFFLPKQTPD